MEIMAAKDAAEKWGISQRRVAVLCAEKRIPNAVMVGNMWVLPADAEKPSDARSDRYSKSEGAVKPFLKWAGGKGQLLHEIERYYPFDGHTVTKYAEPFVGGGAVLFDILDRFDLEAVYISDINAQLICTYQIIRDEVNELINILSGYQSDYLPMDPENRRRYYTDKREQFNRLIIKCEEEDRVKQAALMIFLNRTCFNGLYRVNRHGLFNVPIGSYKKPLICDEANLRAASDKLQGVQIVCGDYRHSSDFIDNHTFVYFDPPYRPITQTSSFTAYTESAFGDEQQRELAEFASEMGKRGARIVVSNSDPQNADTEDHFFDEIYSSHKIARVDANRMINSNSDARGKIKELLISNY